MAKELGYRGITANTIAPGAIETDFLEVLCTTFLLTMSRLPQ
ncbi:hypothetical protein [Heyndrickxia oleronia]|nr:hypothetical protein [Heyndrickxia oleronia]MCI1591224.1 hypothetical protein [Heyndrickxia oleronia]MCI1615517.1 hypothetical protein [Heyndrickxia oleronia]MCI1745962.1 hypothetical protein [Heyndrickxia oleronia]MCI1763518.1 hypothetical protein [Heyndrickxia oleronia]